MSEYNDNRLTPDERSDARPNPDLEIEEFEELIPRRRRERMRHDTPLDVEVVRVRRRDDFDQPITEPEPADGEDEAESAATDAEGEGERSSVPVRERFKLLRQIVLGTILNADSVRENYRYAILIAVMLFLSIVMLFSSLGSYLRYTKLEDEVHLMRERAIRMSEQRYEQSSHSAIVRRLNERGIHLKDPQEPHELLD